MAVFPGVEALDELKVQTGIYPAEFGRALGAVVSLQTRSGANAFRGTAFEFLRNGRFDANDWFNNRAGRPKPDFSFHQFGGALGGPIVRNRTFFFGDYQGLRIDQDLTLVSTVPSDAMRAGDFSELRRTLYDPRTGAPFPGNIIPSDRIDDVARNVIEELYPRANTPGRRVASGQTIDNYVINPEQRRRDDQFDVRVDHAFSAANRAFLRYSLQDAWRRIPPSLPRGDGSAVPGTYDTDAQSLAVNDTHVFGPGVMNELRVGWSAIDIGIERVGFGENIADADGHPRRQPRRTHERDGHDRVCDAGHARSRVWRRPRHGEHQRVPGDRQRDLRARPPHAQGGRQSHPPEAARLLLRHPARPLRSPLGPDVELCRVGARLRARSQHGIRVCQLHPRSARRLRPVDAGSAVHGTPSGGLGVRAGRPAGRQPADAESRPSMGSVRAVRRRRRSPVELRHGDGPVRRGVAGRADWRDRRGAAPADLLEDRLRPAPGICLRPARHRSDDAARRVRHVLEHAVDGHRVVEGAESAVSAGAAARRIRRRTSPS